MRSRILASLIVIALCACVTAFEQAARLSPGAILIVSSGEPNDGAPVPAQDPNKTWDPAEHLVADWDSVAVNIGSLLMNPRRHPDGESPSTQWFLSVTSVVDIIDSNGLIAYSPAPTSVVALDQDGHAVSRTTGSLSVRMYERPDYVNGPVGPNGEWVSGLTMNHISLKLPMEPNAVYPEALSRVEWTMNVLVAGELKTIDIPFEPNETWVELTPGMEAQVEQAIVEEGKYQYRIKEKCDATKVDYLLGGILHLWNDEQPPAVAVWRRDVLNAEGRSIRDLGGGNFSSGGSGSGSNTQMILTTNGTGSCDACGTATTIRYTLVFGMYEQEARFVLADIPVPQF